MTESSLDRCSVEELAEEFLDRLLLERGERDEPRVHLNAAAEVSDLASISSSLPTGPPVPPTASRAWPRASPGSAIRSEPWR